MFFWLMCIAGLMAAYLFGSIPTAFLTGRMLKGIDIREHGSKSVGATNALRTLGKGPGLFVLLVDILKGTTAIAFVRWLFSLPYTTSFEISSTDLDTKLPWVLSVAGVAALLGHSRSVWLKFAGGKSAATGLGVLIAISWPVALGAAVAFGIFLALFRIASLSSMLAALTATALVIGLNHPLPYQLLVISGSIYVIARHRANIYRLLSGTEPRLGQSKPD